MRTLRFHRRFAVWLAALAVLFGALAPAISHALGSSRGLSWMEVCSVQGFRLVRADGADKRETPVAGHVLEHCPFCSIHVPVLGVPVAESHAPLRIDLRTEFPVAFFAADHTLHAWVSAQPRAPPSKS